MQASEAERDLSVINMPSMQDFMTLERKWASPHHDAAEMVFRSQDWSEDGAAERHAVDEAGWGHHGHQYWSIGVMLDIALAESETNTDLLSIFAAKICQEFLSVQ